MLHSQMLCTAPSGCKGLAKRRDEPRGSRERRGLPCPSTDRAQLGCGKRSGQQNQIPHLVIMVFASTTKEKRREHTRLPSHLAWSLGWATNHIGTKAGEQARGWLEVSLTQTVCLRVHQLTLYLGRLQAAACGKRRLLFPLLAPQARAGSSPGCRGAGQRAGREEPASSGAPPCRGERESPEGPGTWRTPGTGVC